ncbi:LON peptidase substrate-binding domain-containing protein [Gimesia aquarii]|uniref:Lon protease n=1 Tax=Gimesia aquarii TaxID=2527964 RepID=A0A517WPU2_9PLAN|nr:LON peptidase substrate-binding domain-containing protein [Gimesia aquarii]QDU07264.1 Lon protease [Gimesia aquarii]
MSSHGDLTEQHLKGFSGVAPILKLEDRVLLPHSLLQIRVTAVTDCQLIAAALTEKSFVAVLFKQSHLKTDADLHRDQNTGYVCLASIVTSYELESGGYSILLRGVCRAHAVMLKESDQLYGMATLELKRDYYASQPMIHREHRHLELLNFYSRIFSPHISDPIHYNVLHQEISLGHLCDNLASTSSLEPTLCQLILEEYDVDLRSDLLLTFLKKKQHALRSKPSPYAQPIEFSQN